jgi:hypothetical protein
MHPVQRARSVNTHITLATTTKGTTTMVEYCTKMKAHADEMAASGQPLGDEEFVSYVISSMKKFTISLCLLLSAGLNQSHRRCYTHKW